MSKCVAEFGGTYSVVLTVGCNVLGGNAQWAGVSIARVLMVTIYGLASISGANITPVVSVAVGLLQTPSSSSLDCMTAGTFYCVQIMAGVAAAFGKNKACGPAIGFTIIVGSYGAGAFFSGCSNPVVAIGFWWCLAYSAFVLLGAAPVAGFSYVAQPKDFGGERGMPAKFVSTYIPTVSVGPNVCASSTSAAPSIVNVEASAQRCTAQRRKFCRGFAA